MLDSLFYFVGFLLVSMYQQVNSSLLGHVDLSEPTPLWKTLSICPTGLTNDQNTGKKLSVVGKGSGLSFTVQIAEGASEIALDEPHTVNVEGDEVSVFRFNPRQGISDKQLDITATSQSTVAAYLKVSQNCEEVAVQKDLESINYKKESLRLSFATKGRITLSSVSIPPLTDSVSRWFIGIGLKNLSGDVKLSGSKHVTLKLTRSFDYNYATPICILFFVSFAVGILMSTFAFFLLDESLTKIKSGKGNQVNNNANLKVFVCKMWEVIKYHWLSASPKTYSFTTGIVGVTLMIGASQFVFADWDTMIQEGDRDKCYYNDFCYRVVNYDIPFNLMISNLTYIVHGLILVVWVLMLETKVNLPYSSGRAAVKEKATEKSYFFSIGYAFSWALVFRGLLSALCHLCPGVYTFQFDSAFMFIIASLIVLLSYIGTKKKSSRNEYLVDAPNFFLFIIMPLLIFNFFFALLISNSGINKTVQRFFYAFLIIWLVMMVFSGYFAFNIHQKPGSDDGVDRSNAFLFILTSLLIPGCFLTFDSSDDPAHTFLFACIACSFLAVLARLWGTFRKSVGKGTLQYLFFELAVIISTAAVFVFPHSPTTNNTWSPENSRNLNKECVIFGFFDWRCLWHFLSSFALLTVAFVVMFISSEPEQRGKRE